MEKESIYITDGIENASLSLHYIFSERAARRGGGGGCAARLFLFLFFPVQQTTSGIGHRVK